MPQTRTDKFHGYVNILPLSTVARLFKILGGEGLKLFVKDLDGNVKNATIITYA